MRVKTECPRHWFIGKTVWPSGLRRQTQVLVERSAWVRTPQLSLCRSAAAPVLLKETGLPIASTPHTTVLCYSWYSLCVSHHCMDCHALHSGISRYPVSRAEMNCMAEAAADLAASVGVRAHSESSARQVQAFQSTPAKNLEQQTYISHFLPARQASNMEG